MAPPVKDESPRLGLKVQVRSLNIRDTHRGRPTSHFPSTKLLMERETSDCLVEVMSNETELETERGDHKEGWDTHRVIEERTEGDSGNLN